MKERFSLDPEANILFIDFAGLRIESRQQVDDFAIIVRAAYETQGGRLYAIANYEGTEIAPEIVDYYGGRIKELQDRYALATVRYSSSGLTRSMLRYLGAAKDLESNTFATREEAIGWIEQLERRRLTGVSGDSGFDPRRGLIGRYFAVWTGTAVVAAAVLSLAIGMSGGVPHAWIAPAAVGAGCTFALGGIVTALFLACTVTRPLRRMKATVQLLMLGVREPIDAVSSDEVGDLARTLDGAAQELRRDIEWLSALYHISLLTGLGADTGKICGLVTRKIAMLLSAKMCVILLRDEQSGTVTIQPPAYGVSDEHAVTLRLGQGERSVAARVFETGEPYMTNTADADPLVDEAAVRLLGVRTLLAVPLQAGDQVLGVLEVMNKDGGFLEEEKRLVTIFASQVAALLVNARLVEQLIASERLAAAGELVAGVAHEVRNPLFAITTTLTALSRRLEDQDALRPYIHVVTTETDRLNHLMEQLLEHGRPLRLAADEEDFAAVIGEAVADVAVKAREKDITVDLECPQILPRFQFDPRKMHSVFVNLLDNALWHTGVGGRVGVRVATMGDGAVHAAELKVELSDTGTGIAPEHLGRVFEPFFTTRTTGTGLGLSIVRKTIHDHGGSIAVHSVPGGGTVFTIALPLRSSERSDGRASMRLVS